MHQRQAYEGSGRAVIPASSGTGIQEYHNLLLCESIVASVFSDNRQRKEESDQTQIPTKFRHILQLPRFRSNIEDHKRNISVLYTAQFTKEEIYYEKQCALADQFRRQHEQWTESCHRLDEYSARMHVLSDDWPSDFPKGRTRSDNAADLEKWLAPDQPMFVSLIDAMPSSGLDKCGFVEDPAVEHDDFKNRLTWTDEEQNKFVSKYTQHPRKFRLISESLPLKSVKDVIEFYYVNRYRLNLREKEGARRKRGGMKRVFSEGSSKTTRPITIIT
jgi:hypothetical protein